MTVALAVGVVAVTLGLLLVVEESPNDAVMRSAPAKTTSTTRIGKIIHRIFFLEDIWILTGVV
jgi:hypothetical protein